MTLEPVYLKFSEKYTTGWVRADQNSCITIEVDLSKCAIVGEIVLKEEEDKRSIS